MRQWTSDLRDTAVNPKLRMYRTIKSVFGREPYIDLVNDARYRIAITKIRTSSHPLEIERGRHTNPETPIQLRVCLLCKEVEDEKHFVLSSKKYAIERLELIQKISGRHEYFMIELLMKNTTTCSQIPIQIFCLGLESFCIGR